MIKHIVMWKLKDNAEGRTKVENAQIMKVQLEALKDVIPQLRHIEVGVNFLQSDAAYDAVLTSVFDTVEDLNIYQTNPDHLKVGEFIGRVRVDRTVVDYEV